MCWLFLIIKRLFKSRRTSAAGQCSDRLFFVHVTQNRQGLWEFFWAKQAICSWSFYRLKSQLLELNQWIDFYFLKQSKTKQHSWSSSVNSNELYCISIWDERLCTTFLPPWVVNSCFHHIIVADMRFGGYVLKNSQCCPKQKPFEKLCLKPCQVIGKNQMTIIRWKERQSQ